MALERIVLCPLKYKSWVVPNVVSVCIGFPYPINAYSPLIHAPKPELWRIVFSVPFFAVPSPINQKIPRNTLRNYRIPF